MTYLLRFTAVLVVSTLAACGGKSFDAGGGPPNEGGSSGEGGSGSVAGRGGGGPQGGSAHAGTSPTAGSPAGGSGQGGEADACEAFNDDPATFIEVDIVNETSRPIYLGGEPNTCSPQRLFGIEDENGQTFVLDAQCRTSCSEARSHGPIGCPTLCVPPSAIALQPGEQYVTNFSGIHYAVTKMPKQCLTSPNGSQECMQALLLEPGTFTFSSIASSSIECSLSSAQCDVCQPNGAGGCTINGAVRSGTELHASTEALLDGSYGIYPKKLPAPGEGSSDVPGSGALPAPRIRIVFF